MLTIPCLLHTPTCIYLFAGVRPKTLRRRAGCNLDHFPSAAAILFSSAGWKTACTLPSLTFLQTLVPVQDIAPGDWCGMDIMAALCMTPSLYWEEDPWPLMGRASMSAPQSSRSKPRFPGQLLQFHGGTNRLSATILVYAFTHPPESSS